MLSFNKADASAGDSDGTMRLWRVLMLVASWILLLAMFPVSLLLCLKIVREYERVVVFRLGRIRKTAQGPGVIFVNPCSDSYRKVDLRVLTFDVPPQEVLSKDSVTVTVEAVVYFRIFDATVSVTNVEDAFHSSKLLAQTTLRNMLGVKTLAEMLSDRENISLQMQRHLDEGTQPWGVKVERVEVKDVRLPISLQRALAAEAEATREAKAKIIAARGEQKAAHSLALAAEMISARPAAMQLRYLQTLTSISNENNTTILFPLPLDILSAFLPDLATTRHRGEEPLVPMRMRARSQSVLGESIPDLTNVDDTEWSPEA